MINFRTIMYAHLPCVRVVGRQRFEEVVPDRSRAVSIRSRAVRLAATVASCRSQAAAHALRSARRDAVRSMFFSTETGVLRSFDGDAKCMGQIDIRCRFSKATKSATITILH